MPGIRIICSRHLFKTYITQRVRDFDPMPTSLPRRLDRSSPFCSADRPGITPSDYVERIFRFSHAEDSAYKIAVRIMEVVAQADPQMRINIANVNRIAITAVTIAVKLAPERIVFTNDFYQRVGGVETLQEMNRLEIIMLMMIVSQPRGINMISGESPDYGAIFGYLTNAAEAIEAAEATEATEATEAERRYRVAQVYQALRSRHPARVMPTFPGDRAAVRIAEERGREYRRRQRTAAEGARSSASSPRRTIRQRDSNASSPNTRPHRRRRTDN